MIEIVQGDITKVKADAIVNAANNSLLGGGGVDGAIHRAGGRTILEECIKIREKQGGCNTGEAVITTAGSLPAKYVIHTVGPVWSGGNQNEDQLLYNAYYNSLLLASEKQLNSIAFPNISTGVYHFPKERAAQIAIKAITEYLSTNTTITLVMVVCFDEENYAIYSELIKNPDRIVRR